MIETSPFYVLRHNGQHDPVFVAHDGGYSLANTPMKSVVGIARSTGELMYGWPLHYSLKCANLYVNEEPCFIIFGEWNSQL